jgi:hypothetical protein
MYLHRDDIKKISYLVDKFPDAEMFEVFSDNSSGIGAEVTLCVHTKIDDIEGKFEMIVSSVENW